MYEVPETVSSNCSYLCDTSVFTEHTYVTCSQPAFPSAECAGKYCLGICSDNSNQCLTDADCANGAFCDTFASISESCSSVG